MSIGIIVNCLAVVFGGLFGSLAGSKLSQNFKQQMNTILGLCSLGMGIPSIAAMENMPPVIFSIVLGTAVGLLIKVGVWVNQGARLLQKPVNHFYKRPKGLSEEEFLFMLVTAIVLFCASGTGIYGCLDAGMTGDNSILISKSILDLFTATIFACSLGLVTSLIAIPQFVIFLILFLCSRWILPLVNAGMIADFKACGGLLIVATGFRILNLKKFPIADMLPAMVFVMPFSWFWQSVLLNG